MFQTDPSPNIFDAVRVASLLPRCGAGTDAKAASPVETFLRPQPLDTTTTTRRQGPPLSSLERPGSVGSEDPWWRQCPDNVRPARFIPCRYEWWWRRLSNRLETAVAFRSGVVEPVRLARMPVATPTRTMTPDPVGTAGLGAGCRRALLAGQV